MVVKYLAQFPLVLQREPNPLHRDVRDLVEDLLHMAVGAVQLEPEVVQLASDRCELRLRHIATEQHALVRLRHTEARRGCQ